MLGKDRMKEEAHGLPQLHNVLGPLGRVRNSFGMDVICETLLRNIPGKVMHGFLSSQNETYPRLRVIDP